MQNVVCTWRSCETCSENLSSQQHFCGQGETTVATFLLGNLIFRLLNNRGRGVTLLPVTCTGNCSVGIAALMPGVMGAHTANTVLINTKYTFL